DFHVTGVQTCALPIFSFSPTYCCIGYFGIMAPSFIKMGILSKSASTQSSWPPSTNSSVHKLYQLPLGKYMRLPLELGAFTGQTSIFSPKINSSFLWCVCLSSWSNNTSDFKMGMPSLAYLQKAVYKYGSSW